MVLSLLMFSFLILQVREWRSRKTKIDFPGTYIYHSHPLLAANSACLVPTTDLDPLICITSNSGKW